MKITPKIYSKPIVNESELSERTLAWFQTRGIKETTLKSLKVTQSVRKMPPEWIEMETIHFNYYQNEELINIKYRGKQKRFALEKGAKLIPYNMDVCRLFDEVVIVEGEMDVLSYVQCGILNTTSTPNGSTLKSVNLEWLDNSIDFFDGMTKIYLALDADEAGQNVTTELIRRLGAYRCYIVDFKGCVDANEYMQKYGEEALKKTIADAREVPIANVSGVLDWENEFDSYVVNGMQKGYGIGCESFDKIFTTYLGQYIVVTGKPSCVLGDTKVLMEDGSRKQIKDVKRGDTVISVSEQYKTESDIVSEQWKSGVKPIYEMELQSGKILKATKEHGVMTFDGWKRLGDLNVGDFVAVPNNVSFNSKTISVDHLKLMALWIAEGNTELLNKTSNNVRWEQITDISYLGEFETYDIEVAKNHNFIANDIVVHNSGKSDWVDQMTLGYAMLHGWKTAIASPENMPYTIHAGKLMSKMSGMWVNKEEYLSTGWYKKGKEFVHNHYKYISLKRFGLEEVLERTKELIKRYGIKVLVIDPYNKVRLHSSLHKGVNDYTNDYLNMIDEFAREHDILIFLVAHPVKPSGEERATYEPDFYSIKGGGEFYDMSPHGLLVHRDYANEMVKIKVLKVKFNHLGENQAHIWQSWNKGNGRYMDWQYQSEHAETTSGLIDDKRNWILDKFNDSKQESFDFNLVCSHDDFMMGRESDRAPF